MEQLTRINIETNKQESVRKIFLSTIWLCAYKDLSVVQEKEMKIWKKFVKSKYVGREVNLLGEEMPGWLLTSWERGLKLELSTKHRC